ncbi:MAG: iron-only hydrogenase system regulator [Brevinematales bacterium]|nr:iron-only hydrogenase system regulator [Brevinematales bacterium]
MERRLGVVAILVYSSESVKDLNLILSGYGEIIIGRMGLPLRDKKVNVISLIVDGTTDEIGAMTGKIGRLKGISVKSMLTEFKD